MTRLEFVHQVSNFRLELVSYITASQMESLLRVTPSASLRLAALLGVVGEREDALCVAQKLRHRNRRVANFVLPVYLQTQPLESSHQKLNHRRVTFHRGVHQRGVPPGVHDLRVRAASDQDLHHIQVASLTGVAERRASVTVLTVNVGPSLQQKLHKLTPSVAVGQQDRRDEGGLCALCPRVHDLSIQRVQNEPGQVDFILGHRLQEDLGACSPAGLPLSLEHDSEVGQKLIGGMSSSPQRAAGPDADKTNPSAVFYSEEGSRRVAEQRAA